jgi:hypothetical protein
LTYAQMNPTRAYLHALIALTVLCMFNGSDGLNMRTSSVCHRSSSYSDST